jgi:hypothetical protein
MKSIRYIFFIFAVLMALNVRAQLPYASSASAPTTTFQSTSAMTATGSNVASAAATGGVFKSSMTTGKRFISVGPRREGEDDEGGFGGDGTEPGDYEDPHKDPIGEGVWAMIIMAAGYCLFRKKVKKICTIEK